MFKKFKDKTLFTGIQYENNTSEKQELTQGSQGIDREI